MATRATNGTGNWKGKITMINLDFSSVPSRDPLEEGVYQVTITNAEEVVSSTGNPMLKIECTTEENRKLWNNYVLTEKCLWKMKELCRAIGYDTSEALQVEAADFIGQEFNAKVVQEIYNGEIVNRIAKALPL